MFFRENLKRNNKLRNVEIEWPAETIMKIEMFWSLLNRLNFVTNPPKRKIIVTEKNKPIQKHKNPQQIIPDFGY